MGFSPLGKLPESFFIGLIGLIRSLFLVHLGPEDRGKLIQMAPYPVIFKAVFLHRLRIDRNDLLGEVRGLVGVIW